VAMNRDAVVAAVGDVLMPTWSADRDKFDRIDRWARWDHDPPHRPKNATAEYKELAARAQAPWGALIVSSVVQTLYVDGYRRPKAPEDNRAWLIWQANGWDARQIHVHRAALTYGIAYAYALPGKTLSGEPMPKLRGVSPREMVAVYDDPADDDFPQMAMLVRKARNGYRLRVFDERFVHDLFLEHEVGKPKYVGTEVHDVGVCPVVRYANRFDLEGRAVGEIEPFIPILGRIDQTVFDRLVVQRFASWIVRTIAGMDVKKSADENEMSVREVLSLLRVNDFLLSPDKDTKFGSLPATPLDGFIKAEERDLTDLAAVSQTPAFELLGGIANLSAEALDALKSSQDAKSDEVKHQFGESHELLLRLAAHIAGDTETAEDYEAQVIWKDTSIRSLAHAADAFGKLCQSLGVPPEVLWPKIPVFTQQDVDEAKRLAAESDATDALLRELVDGASSFPAEVA